MQKNEYTIRLSDIDRRLLKRIADALDRKSPKVAAKRLREPVEGYSEGGFVSGTTLIKGDEIGFRDTPTKANLNVYRHVVEQAEEDNL